MSLSMYQECLLYCATTALDSYPLHLNKIRYIQIVTSVYICGTAFCEPWQSTLLASSLLPSTLLPADFCFCLSQATHRPHPWLIHISPHLSHLNIKGPAQPCNSYHF